MTRDGLGAALNYGFLKRAKRPDSTSSSCDKCRSYLDEISRLEEENTLLHKAVESLRRGAEVEVEGSMGNTSDLDRERRQRLAKAKKNFRRELDEMDGRQSRG